jgi:hypothetical protein
VVVCILHRISSFSICILGTRFAALLESTLFVELDYTGEITIDSESLAVL